MSDDAEYATITFKAGRLPTDPVELTINGQKLRGIINFRYEISSQRLPEVTITLWPREVTLEVAVADFQIQHTPMPTTE